MHHIRIYGVCLVCIGRNYCNQMKVCAGSYMYGLYVLVKRRSVLKEYVFDVSGIVLFSRTMQKKVFKGNGNIFGNEIVVESVHFLGCVRVDFSASGLCHRKFMVLLEQSYDHCEYIYVACLCVKVFGLFFSSRVCFGK